MAIELTGIVSKHERRIRLIFSNALAGSAFGTPAPSQYVIDNEDGAGPSPGVQAAIVVSGAVTNVELALDADLAEGALYRVRAIGIAAVDASVTTSASDQHFRFGVTIAQPNTEPKGGDADLLLYGRDIVWTGTDYGETAEGDMATIAGERNAESAIRRRMLGAPLAWAPNYSPRSREFVDAPIASIGSLRGRLEEQARRDDRVKSVTARLIIDEDTPEDSYFEVTPTLIGGQTPQSFDVAIVVP